MQTMGIQSNGQVALAVAQRGVQQNPGGATGQLAGVGTGQTAPAPQRRGRSLFRRNVARQVQGTGQQAGTPTTNNPVATQLLLNPTFTPIQADAVIDPLNMRIAIPVGQVDGEFIITMANAGAAPQPEAAAPQQPAEGQAQGQTPAAEGQTPSANGTATATETTPAEASSSESASASASAEAKPAEGQAEPAPERRQEPAGEAKPPTGAIFITMKEVDKMVELLKWGGQAPVGQMMTDYVKANNGTN